MKEIKYGNLAAQIDIQNKAVVSSELLRKPIGTVTLFAFDRGQGLSEHSAPFDALVQVLEGEMKITIATQSFRLACGEYIIMPAHDPHALEALTPAKMLLTMVKTKEV